MLIEQFICREDNYGILIHDETSGKTAAIDAPDGDAVLEALSRRGWSLDLLLITHHHDDHVAGIATIKAATGAKVIGPKPNHSTIYGLDQLVGEGDKLIFSQSPIVSIATPGHTLDSISYYLPLDQLVFTGDTLFSLGCGRLFEGSPSMMLMSLKKLAALPGDTNVYCGHEYTQSNGQFAVTIDDNNQALKERMAEVCSLRLKNLPTLPTTIATECETNPFLRWNSPEIRANLGLTNADEVTVFAEIRKRKDQF